MKKSNLCSFTVDNINLSTPSAFADKTFMKYAPIFLVLFAFVGCGPAKPSNLPPLAPCTVKVHDNGRPLGQIGISFQRVEGQAGWSLSAQTGSNGIAVAQTIAGSYRAKGIPTGTYRVSLSERIELPPELIVEELAGTPIRQMEETAKKQQKYLDEHRTVPEILCDAARTPLELTVTASGAELDIDVARYK